MSRYSKLKADYEELLERVCDLEESLHQQTDHEYTQEEDNDLFPYSLFPRSPYHVTLYGATKAIADHLGIDFTVEEGKKEDPKVIVVSDTTHKPVKPIAKKGKK